jgi:CRP-like cAMP-binding protein
MFLPKSDIFKQLGHAAVDEISQIASEEIYGEGAILFEPGDPLSHFFILVEGELEVSIGKFVPKKYTVNNLGEFVAWCSLVGIDRCVARIRCSAPTKVLKIEKRNLDRILDAHPRSGLAFYRHLAGDIARQFVTLHQFVAV